MQIVALLPEQPDETHFRICQKAEARLAGQVDGNGLRADQVRLQRHETLVHQLPGSLDISLQPAITHTQMAGTRPAGEVAGSEQDALAKAASLGAELLKSKSVTDELELQLDKVEAGGWGADPLQISLKQSTKKVYSVVDKCLKCAGATKIACSMCGATGTIPCGQCGGGGTTQCLQCFGVGRINNNGVMTPCLRCQSTGRWPCTACQGQRRVTCTTCRGTRATLCHECEGSGAWTHIFDVFYNANVSFLLDRKQIPEDVQGIVDRLGVKKLETEEHAEVFRLPFALATGHGYYPMLAFLPIAKGEIAVAGKPEEVVVAGLNGVFVDIAPVLDKYLKSGIGALLKLSKGPMAAQALIDQALKFKALRGILSGLMHHSKKAVYLKLQKDYPLIISDKYMRAGVRYAAEAILAIAEGPRNKGLLAGSLLGVFLAGLYFFTPARGVLLAELATQNLGRHIIIADILVWVTAWLVTLYMIKISALKALRAMLPDEEEGKRGLPAAGKQGLYALLLTFLFWSLAAFGAPEKPDWMLSLLKAAKFI